MQLLLSNLFLVLMANMSHAGTLTCQEGHFRTTTYGATTTSKQSYCYNEDRTALYSKTCRNKNCLAFQQVTDLFFEDLLDPNSNPGFVFCRKLGAKPELLEFQAGAAWFKLDRCTFKDGSYTSTSELVHHYMRNSPLKRY